jgi:hypothetical protein
MITAKLTGVEEVIKLLDDMGKEFTDSAIKPILGAAARVVVKRARQLVPQTGEIRDLAKRDLGVFYKKGPNGYQANAGFLYRDYDLHGERQKIAPIIRHMTSGFHQTNRNLDGKTHSRGKVANQQPDFVKQAAAQSQQEIADAMIKPIIKKIRNYEGKQGLTITA